MPIDIDYREHVWYRRGFQEGKAEGIAMAKAELFAEGKLEAQVDIIRKMHRKGYSVEAIADILEFSPEWVKRSLRPE